MQIEAVGREPARYHLLLVAIDTPAVLAKRFSVAVNRAAHRPPTSSSHTQSHQPVPLPSPRAQMLVAVLLCTIRSSVVLLGSCAVRLPHQATTTFRVVVPSLSREVLEQIPRCKMRSISQRNCSLVRSLRDLRPPLWSEHACRPDVPPHKRCPTQTLVPFPAGDPRGR